jgi:hypothetical protein
MALQGPTMREFCMKISSLQNSDAARISAALRAVNGVTAVEVDVSSGWVVARGHGLIESQLLAGVRASGLTVERVLHDPPSEA